jgi:mRNA interferase RelE/StbE
MYKLLFTKSASKALQRAPKHVIRRVRVKLDKIVADPYGDHPSVTKLRGRSGYRLRVGDWRVIYEIDDETVVVVVLAIGPRGDIYR